MFHECLLVRRMICSDNEQQNELLQKLIQDQYPCSFLNRIFFLKLLNVQTTFCPYHQAACLEMGVRVGQRVINLSNNVPAEVDACFPKLH